MKKGGLATLWWKRLFDSTFAVVLLAISLPVMVVIGLAICIDSPGPILFRQTRIGKGNVPFEMLKFRTMAVGTPDIPTHMLPSDFNGITRVGRFLRKTSLDELPQLLNVLRGDMSIVGPRPALHNQTDLIDLRTKAGVHVVRPGITGLAQVNGRDELTIPEKVALDQAYVTHLSLRADLEILLKTVLPVIRGAGVSH